MSLECSVLSKSKTKNPGGIQKGAYLHQKTLRFNYEHDVRVEVYEAGKCSGYNLAKECEKIWRNAMSK
jgi:hypothetical protein